MNHINAINALHLFSQKSSWQMLALVHRHRQQSDGALVISRLSAEDAGFYTCVASNGRDRDERRIQIRPRGTEEEGRILFTGISDRDIKLSQPSDTWKLLRFSKFHEER